MKHLLVISSILLVLIISGCSTQTNGIDKTNEDPYAELIECETLDQETLINKCKEVGRNELSCEYLDMNGLISECWIAVQRASGNPQICDYYENVSGKDFCLFNVGVGSLNENVCSLAHNFEEVEGAFASWRDACYKEVAIGKKSLTLCEKIEGSNVKDECFFKVAVAIGDPNLCRNIENNRSEYICSREIKDMLA
jgi:hypothetical protein